MRLLRDVFLVQCGYIVQFAVLIALGCVGCGANGDANEPSAALANATSVSGSSSGASSDPEAVAAPDIRVGDVWTDRVLDGNRE
ncbi:MAG: hypothetical protein WAU82_22895, partial [Candidatus Binatus sp.]